VLAASGEVVIPRLLAMLAVVAVFVPSFFMTGVSRSLFVPLSLAVGFAMIASFLLSSSLVPVLSVWMLAGHPITESGDDWVARLRERLARTLRRSRRLAAPLVVSTPSRPWRSRRWSGSRSAARFFPPAAPTSSSCGSRAPAGTKFESTELLARDVLDEMLRAAGPNNLDVTLGYVGVQPSSYPINTIFLWTGGSHEGVLQIALRPGVKLRLDCLRRGSPPPVPRRFPCRVVLVRARRHRQPIMTSARRRRSRSR
jgi:multidrug efflux pump subunit AcrB